ncbi:hypothetical protein RUM43_008209 [Polyplax serrata]|uniref:Uncharacterized protein n=1 Tax=Polyplax serrata TaxID=468196 RepID=A0AAN8S8A5_POLSC
MTSSRQKKVRTNRVVQNNRKLRQILTKKKKVEIHTQGDECLEIIRLLNNQLRTKTKVNDEDNEETGRFAVVARYSAMDVKADDSEGRTFLENLNKLTEKFQETYPILIK